MQDRVDQACVCLGCSSVPCLERGPGTALFGPTYRPLHLDTRYVIPRVWAQNSKRGHVSSTRAILSLTFSFLLTRYPTVAAHPLHSLLDSLVIE